MTKKIVLTFIFLFSPWTFSKEKDFYKDWSFFLGEFTDALNGVTDSQSLTQLLFNSFSDISAPLYGFKIPNAEPFEGGFGIDLGGGRKVIYNNRIDNSFTVIDKILVGIRPEVSAMYSGVKLSVRSRLNIVITNVRQVGPKDYDRLAPLDKFLEDFKEKFRKEKNRNYTSREIEVDNDTYSNFFPSDKQKVERNATFGRIWNPLTMAFRLPLTPRKALQMAENEILTYTLLGGIELGAGFGVSVDPRGQILRTGVDASVYFKGTYEIVVLKEKPLKKGDNFVRIRIGRHKGLGYTLGLGSEGYTGIDDVTRGHMGPLEGNILWSAAGFFVGFRPFRLEWDHSFWWLFNQVYRFDLNNPEAKKAYQQAVLGRFKLSEKVAFDENGQLRENSPVTRILTSKEKREIQGNRRSIKLFFFSLQRDGVIRTSDKVLVDEKLEEHKYVEAESLNTRVVQFLFAFKEERTHKFLTTIDLKAFNENPRKENALTLLVDAKREDSNTKSFEYDEYVKEVEGALNKPGFFPRAPLSPKKDRFKGLVGKVSFDYQLKFNWPQVEKLINYPEEKMWDALITAFNAKGLGWEDPEQRKKLIAKNVGVYIGTLPVTLVGSKFPPKDNIIVASLKYSYWRKLKDEYLKGAKALSEALGKFFNSGDYGSEMVNLLRVVLHGEKIPYKLRVFNPLLGENPTLFENQIGDFIDPVDKSMNVHIDGFQEDFEKVTVSGLIAELISNEYVRITFDLDKVPYSVFFNLQKINLTGSLTNTSLGSVVMRNHNNIFKKGRNTIMVKIGDKRHPLNNLINQLEVKKSLLIPTQYRFNIAASLEGKRYGWTTSDFFRLIYMQDPTALKKYIAYTVLDLGLCLNRTAMDLILFLEKRPFLLCPETDPHHPDGTCVSGMVPYENFKNKTLTEKIAKRDEWIIRNCPNEGTSEFIQKAISIENVCLGKNPKELVGILGDRDFFVCPMGEPRYPDGTCRTGIIPYQNNGEGNNIKSRNEWIYKYCSK